MLHYILNKTSENQKNMKNMKKPLKLLFLPAYHAYARINTVKLPFSIRF